jgi:hypothetical protein
MLPRIILVGGIHKFIIYGEAEILELKDCFL